MNSIRIGVWKQAQVIKYGVAPISGGAVLEQQAILRRKEEVNYWVGARNEGTKPTQVVYKPLNSSQVMAVMDLFMGPYLDLAPLNRAVGLKRSEAEISFGEKIENSIPKGNSIVALDGETDKVLGVMLNETMLKGRRQYTDNYPDSINRINRLLEHVEGDAFVELADAKAIFKLHDACVKQDYQNMGIGKKLVELSVEKAAEENCDYVIGTATSPLVQMILAEKEQFKTVRACTTKDYVDRHEQEHTFQCIAHSSPQIALMAKALNDRAHEAPF